jgi:hypothetical protein
VIPGDGPAAVMLPDGATDMTGSTLAAILIPPAGTIFLVAWLALVLYAGRNHPPRAGRNRAPGRQSPGTAAPASRRQADARRPDRGRVAVTAARSGNAAGWPVPDQARRPPPPRPPESPPPRSEAETMHPGLPKLSRSTK